MAVPVDVFADDYEPPKPAAPAKQSGPVDVFAEDYKPPEGSGIIRRAVGDTLVSAAKSVIGAGEAAVGLADIPTLGAAGKALNAATGYDPKRTNAALDELYSPEQRIANEAVQRADGAVETIKAAVQNPSVIFHSAVASAAPMFAGGAVARGVRALATPVAERAAAAVAGRAAQSALSPLTAGAIGEGVVGSGLAAEQTRQETATGDLTAKQAGLAVASGAITGAISRLAGAVAKRLGISDVDVLLAGGAAKGANKGLLRRVAEGFVSEGMLEELPQSAQEQVLQNIALDKPWDDGVGNAAAMGALTGGLIGGGVNLFQGRPERVINPPPPAPDLKALPAPGQTTLPMGEGGPATPEQQAAAEAADTNAAAVYAQRAAYEAEQERLAVERTVRAFNPLSSAANIAGLLPAPGATGAPPSAIGPDAGVFPVTQQHATENAVDAAAGVYAARAAKEAELARFASQGTLSTAAATAMGSGAAAQAQAQRQGAADEATRPQAENAIPEPVSAEEKEAGAGIAEQLSRARPMGLAQAQERVASSAGRQELTVVPLPGNAGYAVVASSKLSNRQRAALKGLQAPSGAPVNEAATRMPLATPEAAAARAGRLAMETGREWEVVPHPMARDKFAVRPKAVEQPSTQPSAPTQRGQPQGVNSGTQEAAATQRPSEGVPGNQANEAGAGGGAQAAGPAVAEAPAQINQGAISGGAAATPYAEITRLVSDAATSPENDRAHPTAKQSLAGNYKKVRIPPALVDGLSVTVENPAGSVRVAPDGAWAAAMPHHYGYIRRTEGNDGDKVDIAIGPGKGVFVVNQLDPQTGEFDEHKVMYGFDTQEAAEAAYRAAYPADWKGFGSIAPTTVDELKAWLARGPATTEFGKQEAGPKLDTASLVGITVRTPVQIEETGEVVYEERDAKEALVEARSRARKFEALLRCLRT